MTNPTDDLGRALSERTELSSDQELILERAMDIVKRWAFPAVILKTILEHTEKSHSDVLDVIEGELVRIETQIEDESVGDASKQAAGQALAEQMRIVVFGKPEAQLELVPDDDAMTPDEFGRWLQREMRAEIAAGDLVVQHQAGGHTAPGLLDSTGRPIH